MDFSRLHGLNSGRERTHVSQSSGANEGWWHKRGTGLFASYCPHTVAQSCMHQSVHTLSHILACIKVSTNCRAFLYASKCPQTVAHSCMHHSGTHYRTVLYASECPHTVPQSCMHQRVTTLWRTVMYASESDHTLSHSHVCIRE